MSTAAATATGIAATATSILCRRRRRRLALALALALALTSKILPRMVSRLYLTNMRLGPQNTRNLLEYGRRVHEPVVVVMQRGLVTDSGETKGPALRLAPISAVEEAP